MKRKRVKGGNTGVSNYATSNPTSNERPVVTPKEKVTVKKVDQRVSKKRVKRM